MRTMTGAAALVAALMLVGPLAHADDPPPASDGSTHHHHHHSRKHDKAADGATPAPSADQTAAPATGAAATGTATGAAAAPAAAQPDTLANAPSSPPAAPTPTVVTQAQSELPDSHTAAERPWVKGVSVADQKAALELFREANALLKESLFVQAATKYREALRHWDHPGIHYNLALALLNLDQPIEVYQNLQAALKYGPQPLDADKYDHANRYRALIEKQLARIEVRCTQPGAIVTMDGLKLFTAPGRYEGLVRVGQHTVVAQHEGFVTVQKTPTLPAGEKTTIDLRLYTAEQLTRYRRRWPVLMPPAVLAAGVIIAGIGGILHWQANEQFKQYDRGVASCSLGTANGGCMPSSSLAGKRSSGDAMQATAFVAYGVGAGLAIAGGVLVFLNRAHPYHVDADGEATPPPVVVAPVASRTGAGVAATIRF